MTAILFLFLIVLAFLHFIYEGIVAPTLRTGLNYKMHALRDRLWHLRTSSANSTSPAFDIIKIALNRLFKTYRLL